jgi:hypothetical protein
MKKLVLFYNVVVVSVLTVTGFLSATTIPQLVSSIFFFPLAVYFWRMIAPEGQQAIIPVVTLKPVHQPRTLAKNPKNKKDTIVELEPVEEIPEGKFDLNRRTFLRLIGSAGVSVFLLSIFTGKAEAAFFGSVPGPGTVGVKDSSGTLIDPSEKKPTDGYNISNVDDAIPSYYGYVNKDGGWYIIKEDSSGGYRYVKGSSGFSTNWTNRAILSYDYFDAVF